MTRKALTTLLVLMSVFFGSGLIIQKVQTNAAGAPSGHTGSPYDAVSCATIGCHPGIPQIAFGWISTDMPQTGYYPDSIYTITLTATRSGATRFGFQIAAMSMANEFTGTWILDNPVETQFGYLFRYVNQTAAGIYGSGGSKTWTIKWQAPPDDYAVTFYAAFVAGNGNINNDITYLCDQWYQTYHIGIEQNTEQSKLRLFPNPVTNNLGIFVNAANKQTYTFTIFSGNGQIVEQWSETTKQNGPSVFYRNLESIQRGVYIISINSYDFSDSQKILLLN